MYEISNGATVQFTNCTFERNDLKNNNKQAMFFVNNANLIFDKCLFTENIQNHSTLITLTNMGNLSVINSTFIGNINSQSDTYIFCVDSIYSKLYIFGSFFVDNYGYKEIIYVDNSHNRVIIENSTFDNNKAVILNQMDQINFL